MIADQLLLINMLSRENQNKNIFSITELFFTDASACWVDFDKNALSYEFIVSICLTTLSVVCLYLIE